MGREARVQRSEPKTEKVKRITVGKKKDTRKQPLWSKDKFAEKVLSQMLPPKKKQDAPTGTIQPGVLSID
jgi:spore germination cell wall hydrolase CwlJ-like protein